MSSQEQTKEKPDWSATQYSKFLTERTRPVHDLITQIRPHVTNPSPKISDLGCGPGNSSSALLSAFPDAKITGMDSSPDMLAKARTTLPNATFEQGDLATYAVPTGTDLVFSNAAMHWLRSDTRIPTLVKTFQSLKPGAVLAFQMPDNYNEPSHALMRVVATLPSQAWSTHFASASVGDLSNTSRPDLDPIESTETFYDALVPYASTLNIWRTTFMHILKDAPAIVEWVKGTGLQPYLERMGGDEEAKKAFLSEYERKLGEVYGRRADGRVILQYPRFFVVAVRGETEAK